MKKILIIFLLFILILPVSAYSLQDNFHNWLDNYYESNQVSQNDLKELFDDVCDGNIKRNDFDKLKYVYKSVYGANDSSLKNIMDNDFKNGDENKDGELSFGEFKEMFKKTYSYYRDSPWEYNYFRQTDANNDGLVDYDELSDMSHIFTEDTFWDGYSIEEIVQSEFDDGDRNGDGYLNFTEYKIIA